MPCYNTIPAWRGKELSKEGRRPLVFKVTQALDPSEALELPCGQCIYCRLKKSQEWGLRAEKEASLHNVNHFLTLTYDKTHLPSSPACDKLAIPDFLKRLRKYYGNGIRSYGCMEYGDKRLRPHYHLILFNSPFGDLKHYPVHNNHSEHELYTSKSLSRFWPYGISTIGEVTFESAAYVARYNVKAQKRPDEFFEVLDSSTGEVYTLPNPRSVGVSRRPGVGRDWVIKYADQLFRDDFIISRGRKYPLPKFFDRVLAELDPIRFLDLKEKRLADGLLKKAEYETIDNEAARAYEKSHLHSEEQFYDRMPRLRVEEIVHEAKYSSLQRKL